MNIVTTVIKSRHSIRKFKPEDLDENAILDALECAHLAPTAMNLQPWLFGIIKDKDTLEQIASLTDHGKFIADAPLCFAIFGEKTAKYFLEDCCAATLNLIIALQAYGIGSCWVAGHKKDYAEQIRKLLNVPDNYTLVSLVPAGLPVDISIVKKKTTKSVIFYDNFKKE